MMSPLKNVLLIGKVILLLLSCISCNSKQSNIAVTGSSPSAISSPLSYSPPNTPIPEPTFIPTPLPSPTILLTATPTLTSTPISNPLPDFPLNLGYSWVYSATYYNIDQRTGAVITSTYVMTDTIVNTQVYSSYFAAEKRRDIVRLEGPLSEEEWGPGARYSPQHSWYIVSGNYIYKERSLDFSKPESSWFLKFKFPLSNQTKPWYPDPSQRAFFAEQGGCPNWGCSYVKGPITVSVPVGNFDNCYSITESGRGGGVAQWLCPGIGIVGEVFDFSGQQGPDPYPPQYGFRYELIIYSIP